MATSATLGLLAEEILLVNNEHRPRVVQSDWLADRDVFRVVSYCANCERYGVVDITGHALHKGGQGTFRNFADSIQQSLSTCWSTPCNLFQTWSQLTAWLSWRS